MRRSPSDKEFYERFDFATASCRRRRRRRRRCAVAIVGWKRVRGNASRGARPPSPRLVAKARATAAAAKTSVNEHRRAAEKRDANLLRSDARRQTKKRQAAKVSPQQNDDANNRAPAAWNCRRQKVSAAELRAVVNSEVNTPTVAAAAGARRRSRARARTERHIAADGSDSGNRRFADSRVAIKCDGKSRLISERSTPLDRQQTQMRARALANRG